MINVHQKKYIKITKHFFIFFFIHLKLNFMCSFKVLFPRGVMVGKNVLRKEIVNHKSNIVSPDRATFSYGLW